MSENAGVTDRLRELLNQHDVLYGMICRDATLTDIELLAQAGFHVVWIDLEHGVLSVADALRLCRTIVHLGMVPLVRIPELSRAQIQGLVDSGFQIVLLPNVKDAKEARALVGMSKFPPLGHRGVSSNSASIGFAMGDDPVRTLQRANESTHLMVQVEGDEGCANLDAILNVDGIELVTVGPLDWAVERGLVGQKLKPEFDRQVDEVLATALRAGKLTAMGVSGVEQAKHFAGLGVRLLFVGVDVTLKRRIFSETISAPKKVLSQNK
jgi:4-hydroxy-2-oxoheptanedioate aldolase